jgi:hypothetical protein
MKKTLLLLTTLTLLLSIVKSPAPSSGGNSGNSSSGGTNSVIYSLTTNPTNAVGVYVYGSGVNLDGIYLFNTPNYTVTNPVVQSANNDFFYATKQGGTNVVGFNIPFNGNNCIASATNTGTWANSWFAIAGTDVTTNSWALQNSPAFIANQPRMSWIRTNLGVAAPIQGQVFANSPLNVINGGNVTANLYGNGAGISIINSRALAAPLIVTNNTITISWFADSFGVPYGATSSFEMILTGMINSNRLALGKPPISVDGSANNSSYPAWFYVTNGYGYGYNIIGIEAGVNDLRYGLTNYGPNPAQHLINVRSNMIAQAKASGAKMIIMLTIPNWFPYSQYTNATFTNYLGVTNYPGAQPNGSFPTGNNGYSYQSCLQSIFTVNQWCLTQRSNNVIVADINDAAMPYLLFDGLHPNDFGHANIAGNIWNEIVNNASKTQPSSVVQQLYATNKLSMTSLGLTNNTQDTYIFTITSGASMSLKDPSGTEICVPIVNMPIPFKAGWRLTGTAIAASELIILSK